MDSMKFRTEIEVKKWDKSIEYRHKILCLGSCFANNIADYLQRNKFNVTASPTGILFNPASIALAMRHMSEGYTPKEENIVALDGSYVDYNFHSQIYGNSIEELTDAIHISLEQGRRAMLDADLSIVTLGTAWVYRLNATDKVVANCHKQPQRLFRRTLLTVEECEAELETILSLTHSRLLLTLSPVRHIGEGMEDNSLSKAILRVAIANFCRRHPERAEYFPSYEIVVDDLRDYRFYGDDLVHPSPQAVEYVAEKFFEAALSAHAKEQMQRVRSIIAAVGHRPRNPRSEAYHAFCLKQLALMEELSEVDFLNEKALMERMAQIEL